MDPAEKPELLLQITLLQGHNEAHESNRIQGETDHTVVRGEEQEVRIRKYYVLNISPSAFAASPYTAGVPDLEVVDDALSVQEVVRDSEEVPVEGLAPRISAIFLVLFPVAGKREQPCNFAVHRSLAEHHEDDHIHMSQCEEHYTGYQLDEHE